METNTNTNQPLLTWRAPAKVDHERNNRWYAVAGVITITLIAYGIGTGDWVLAVILMLTAGVYFLLRNEKSKQFTVSIYEGGIEIDGVLTPWQEWKNFWILLGTNHAELHVLPLKSNREFHVLLDGTDPFVVRDTMAAFLEYDGKKKEKLFDAFIRFCKL